MPYLTELRQSLVAPQRRAARPPALDEAHESVARGLNADPREIVFTSGGTESINLALKGAAWAGKAAATGSSRAAVEHHAVLNSLHHLEKFGFEVVVLPVDRYGRVDPDAARGGDHRADDAWCRCSWPTTRWAPSSRIGRAGQARPRPPRRALIHVDAVQAAPWHAPSM